MDVFISWSGEQSKQVAEALRRYLPQFINAVEPWFSGEDVAAGARWSIEIADKLENSKFGIICLTPSNLDAPWILFEAGALAKTIDKTYVCPYLTGLKSSEVKFPLAQFQMMLADEQGTRRLVETLNRALEKPRKSEELADAFRMWWPELKKALDAIAKEEAPATQRKTEDMLEELLELARIQARQLPILATSRLNALISQEVTERLGPGFSGRITQEGAAAEGIIISDPDHRIIHHSVYPAGLAFPSIRLAVSDAMIKLNPLLAPSYTVPEQQSTR